MRYALALLLLVGCTAASTRDFTVARNAKVRLTPNISVAFRDGLEVILDSRTVDRVPLDVGAGAVLPIPKRHCLVKIEGYDVLAKPAVARAFVACDDGPAPGSAIAISGSDSLIGLLWTLPAFVVGLLAGFARRKAPVGVAMAALAIMLAAIAVPPMIFASGLYVATYGLLAGFLAVVALGHSAAPPSTGLHPLAIIGALGPVVGFALLFRHWSYGGPAAAAGIALPIWLAFVLIFERRRA